MAAGGGWVSWPAGGRRRAEEVQLRLVCLPPAATGAWIYHRFAEELPAHVEVVPVELPGMGTRSLDARPTSMDAIVDPCMKALLPLLQEKPFVLFGHSMGAWIAFELLCRLAKAGAPHPLKLYASAERAPHLSRVADDVDPTVFHTLQPAAFWVAFERRYGQVAALQDETARRYALPRLRADFQVFETYTPSKRGPTSCPIMAIGALDDPRYRKDQITAWQQHTSSTFHEEWLPG